MALFGRVNYPGIVAYEDFQFTDVSGVTPAVATMTVYPQDDVPDADGDITLECEGNVITLKNMHIDKACYERNSGGKIVRIKFLDERWKWSFGDITGRYNIRLPNNWVNPDHEKSPRELARLCFAAMGVTEYSTAALPDDARPDIDWDHVNPAQALDKLCDDLGCRVVPKRSTGEWIICVAGDGAELPDNFPLQDGGDGIDPKERPDFIKIVSAPWLYQVALYLEPVGRDADMSYKTLENLSYAPAENQTEFADRSAGFGAEWEYMSNISNFRFSEPDGTALSYRELALETVFKYWRISEKGARDSRDGYVDVPGFDGHPKRKQIIMTNNLVNVYTDDRNEEHKKTAYVTGSYFGYNVEHGGNYPDGTRIDFQGQIFQEVVEERSSFSLNLDPIDTDRCFVVTSQSMVTKIPPIPGVPLFVDAEIYLNCAVQVRDPDTWQPVRFEYLKQIGDGDDEDFCLVVIKEDIQPWSIAKYDSVGSFVSRTENADEVQRQCKYYADSIAKTFETIATKTRRYIGLYPIDMDGRIVQVSYEINKQGADTIASTGTEHDFDIPSEDERRQRNGRKNDSDLIKYWQMRTSRLNRLAGGQGTL